MRTGVLFPKYLVDAWGSSEDRAAGAKKTSYTLGTAGMPANQQPAPDSLYLSPGVQVSGELQTLFLPGTLAEPPGNTIFYNTTRATCWRVWRLPPKHYQVIPPGHWEIVCIRLTGQEIPLEIRQHYGL